MAFVKRVLLPQFSNVISKTSGKHDVVDVKQFTNGLYFKNKSFSLRARNGFIQPIFREFKETY